MKCTWKERSLWPKDRIKVKFHLVHLVVGLSHLRYIHISFFHSSLVFFVWGCCRVHGFHHRIRNSAWTFSLVNLNAFRIMRNGEQVDLCWTGWNARASGGGHVLYICRMESYCCYSSFTSLCVYDRSSFRCVWFAVGQLRLSAWTMLCGCRHTRRMARSRRRHYLQRGIRVIWKLTYVKLLFRLLLVVGAVPLQWSPQWNGLTLEMKKKNVWRVFQRSKGLEICRDIADGNFWDDCDLREIEYPMLVLLPQLLLKFLVMPK